MTIFRQLAVYLLIAGPALAWNNTLDSEAVKQHLAKHEHSLIAFVTNADQPSRDLWPEWEAVRQSHVPAMAVSCSDSPDVCVEMDVASVPAIRLYSREGGMQRFRGARTAAAIMASFKRFQRGRANTAVSIEGMSAFSSSDDIVFWADIAAEDESLSQRFDRLATRHRDRYTFGHITQVEADSKLRCYNNVERFQHSTQRLNHAGALDNFIAICTEPHIPTLTVRNEGRYLPARKHIFYCFEEDKAKREILIETLRPVAAKYRKTLQFLAVNPADFEQLPSMVGLESGKGLVLWDRETLQSFPFRGKVTPEEVSNFILAVAEGTAVAWNGAPVKESESGVRDYHDEL